MRPERTLDAGSVFLHCNGDGVPVVSGTDSEPRAGIVVFFLIADSVIDSGVIYFHSVLVGTIIKPGQIEFSFGI